MAVSSHVQLMAMLDRREARANQLQSLSQQYPMDTLVSFTLNVPGPIKNSPALEMAFDRGLSAIRNQLSDTKVLHEIHEATGPEIILKTNQPGEKVKEAMVSIEDSSPLARLYDIDVLFQGNQISRQQLGKDPRRCFLCPKEAKVCARSRRHSVAELTAYLELLFQEEGLK